MTLSPLSIQNAVAPHNSTESFRDFAVNELAAAPPWTVGICFNPSCGREFRPGRDWQIYCGASCAAAGKAEMRKWGHKMALPLLIHRMGKYDRTNLAVMDLTRAARRFTTQTQSAWLEDRKARSLMGGRS